MIVRLGAAAKGGVRDPREIVGPVIGAFLELRKVVRDEKRYDLSDVMLVTSPNPLQGIPLPLRDRMEVLEISGYTEFEKLNIASRYLVPRQLKAAGLDDVNVEIREAALREIVHHYTMESGVRNLEREIGSVCRKIAREVVKDVEAAKTESFLVEAEDVANQGVVVKVGEEARTGVVVGDTNLSEIFFFFF